MSVIIASIYRIDERIGSGGGGIVYLGWHMRLNKKVVLKADRRSLSTQMDKLRQEVDALKNLSHMYIPQVYDFVEQDGVVYTVMDYIEGETLKSFLDRGQRFSQAQVIEWGCQLLEALVYLHSRPPHGILHSDIKPANVMLTPQNEIRLIDFNIALALGEAGAVQVGYSRGYASPEHYGSRDISPVQLGDETAPVSDTETETFVEEDREVSEGPSVKMTSTLPLKTDVSSRQGSFVTHSGNRLIVLDVRSDIYSLGATLYHLLTGVHPPDDARKVVPVSGRDYSQAVADIINRAMNPDPDRRFQTAAEMLYAFEHLRENDIRTRKLRRKKIAAVSVASALFIAGGAMTLIGLKQSERLQNAYALAEYSENALQDGNVPQAVQFAMDALTMTPGLMDPPNTPQAQKALTDALGVYDLSDGFKAYATVTLPSEPLKLAMSPQGSRIAAIYAFEAAIYDTQTGQQMAKLPVIPSAMADIIFLDEDRIVYSGEGGVCLYDVSAGETLWTGDAATQLACAADGGRVAAVYRDEDRAVIYDTESGEIVKTIDFDGKSQRVMANDTFADPEDNLLALSADGRLLAVSFSDGSLEVFDLEADGHEIELLPSGDYTYFQGGFCGKYFAFSAGGAEDEIFVVVDTNRWEQTTGYSSRQRFLLQADARGIYTAVDNVLVEVDPGSGEQTEMANPAGRITAFSCGGDFTYVTTDDQRCMFYDRGANLISSEEMRGDSHFLCLAGDFAAVGAMDSPIIRLSRLESHDEADVLTYDPLDAHTEARLSPEDGTAMLFDIHALTIYGMDGTVLAEAEIPDSDRIYDQQFVRDDSGARLEVTYYDGKVRAWSARDGTALQERQTDSPDTSASEEFETDHLRIVAPLHGAATVYDKETGREIKTLETEDYLTYVTQVGENIITEYMTADGLRYGLLLNGRCEVLARMPYLCDVVDGELIFDYPSGNLRSSPIYTLEELYAMGK